MHPSRRVFLQSTLAAMPAMHGLSSFAAPPSRPKLPVAGIVTSMGNATHGDVIFSKITDGWLQDGGPGPDLSSCRCSSISRNRRTAASIWRNNTASASAVRSTKR